MERDELLMLGKIDANVDTLLELSKKVDERLVVLDKRVTIQEHRWTRVYAYAAVIATMFTFASKYVIDKWLT